MDIIPYLKIPYLHQGRDEQGADCFGLLRLFYHKELGLDLPDYTQDYPVEWWRDQNLFLDLYKLYKFKKTAVREKGTVILFNNTNSTPGHVGIILDDSTFIHMTRTGAGTSNYLYGVWARQVHSMYTLTKAGHSAYKIR